MHSRPKSFAKESILAAASKKSIAWRAEGLGRANVYFNEDNVMAYAMAKLTQ
jgi:hypothetical protein